MISYLIPITKDINISPLIKYSFAWTRDTIDYKESKFLVASSISNELSFGLSLQFLLIKRLPIDLFTEYRKRIGGSESLKISEGFYFGIRLGWAILNDN